MHIYELRSIKLNIFHESLELIPCTNGQYKLFTIDDSFQIHTLNETTKEKESVNRKSLSGIDGIKYFAFTNYAPYSYFSMNKYVAPYSCYDSLQNICWTVRQNENDKFMKTQNIKDVLID
eukprot:745288_1